MLTSCTPAWIFPVTFLSCENVTLRLFVTKWYIAVTKAAQKSSLNHLCMHVTPGCTHYCSQGWLHTPVVVRSRLTDFSLTLLTGAFWGHSFTYGPFGSCPYEGFLVALSLCVSFTNDSHLKVINTRWCWCNNSTEHKTARETSHDRFTVPRMSISITLQLLNWPFPDAFPTCVLPFRFVVRKTFGVSISKTGSIQTLHPFLRLDGPCC